MTLYLFPVFIYFHFKALDSLLVFQVASESCQHLSLHLRFIHNFDREDEVKWIWKIFEV